MIAASLQMQLATMTANNTAMTFAPKPRSSLLRRRVALVRILAPSRSFAQAAASAVRVPTSKSRDSRCLA
jgi:hypothetical protein